METKTEKKQPIHKIKIGQVEAAVWLNDFDGKKSFSVSFQKNYKDKKGEWKQSTSFATNNLPDVYWASQEAYVWIKSIGKTYLAEA